MVDILQIMKKVKLVLSGLLVAMFFFAVHDYLFGQSDFTDNPQKEKKLVNVEHNVFHIPMLHDESFEQFYVEFEEKTHFTLQDLVVVNIHNPLFKPPRKS